MWREVGSGAGLSGASFNHREGGLESHGGKGAEWLVLRIILRCRELGPEDVRVGGLLRVCLELGVGCGKSAVCGLFHA